MHTRFNRKVWTFKSYFDGALAKWLVQLSPYTVPDNINTCIEKFHEKLGEFGTFDTAGMAEVELSTLTERVYAVLEGIPEVMALNERKNGRDGIGITTRYSQQPDPDDDFIDIMALAQNITCEFADKADAECWLGLNSVDTIPPII